MRHEVTTRRVLYEIPGMQSVPVRDATFTGGDGEPLPMRIYGTRGPTVVIVEGYPDPGFSQKLGCRFMDMEWTISMAQLIAASGMTAVTHSNRDPKADAIALLKSFAAQRVGIWATSGHGPVALTALEHASCGVLINPIVDEGPHDGKALFIVRSGADETPGLNAALDAFVTRAIAANRPLTVVNYPEAPHAFDLFLDTPETGRILQQGLEFLRAHLG
jgi:hypothetical protein